MMKPNVARELELAISNASVGAPEAALPLLKVWQQMAGRAAAEIDELHEFNEAIAIPLTDGGRLRIVKEKG
jgi:hypothetical protein